MKARLTIRHIAAFLSFSVMIALSPIVHAQALPAQQPPAYGVAQRLAAQSHAAAAIAQADIARRRALQAVRQYQAVVSSATYRHTPFAPEALFQAAQLQENSLQDNYAADQSYQNIRNNYAGVHYPSEAQAHSEQARLETKIDAYNKTHYPGSILYKVLDTLVILAGGRANPYSYVIAIFFLSLLVKLVLTPLSNKQYASMKQMQRLQPYIEEIKAKYKNDKEAQGRKVMEVYKEHGVNPAGGCFPALIQLPIFIGLYQAIRLYQFQFAHGQFLWIGSPLAHLYPTILGANLGQPDIPILLLYALSMYVTQKMTITPSSDPQQAEMQRATATMMPFMMTFMFLQYHLPSAFLLYYLIFNIISTAQQMYFMRKRAGEDSGDGGAKVLRVAPALPGSGSGSGNPMKLTTNGNGNGLTKVGSGRNTPLAQAQETETIENKDKFSRRNGNGATPTARGVIAPKVHPKKKRR